jgi:uncharacterized membrane protein YgdD (TMEM256/DUF423 family)
MKHSFALLGALCAFLAVAAGAFGTHALRDTLPQESLTIFETGARYQIYHVLALLTVACVSSRWPGSAVQTTGWLFATKIVVFSGNLYLLALTNARWLGTVTPLGGIALLSGWLALVRGR